MNPSPLFSFLVLFLLSWWIRNRPALVRKTEAAVRSTGGATSYLLAPHPTPTPREETEGTACEGRRQEIWTASQLLVQACVLQSGLKGASYQVLCQGWCHFHRELSYCLADLGTKGADQRMWWEWNPEHVGPHEWPGFFDWSGRRGSPNTTG